MAKLSHVSILVNGRIGHRHDGFRPILELVIDGVLILDAPHTNLQTTDSEAAHYGLAKFGGLLMIVGVKLVPERGHVLLAVHDALPVLRHHLELGVGDHVLGAESGILVPRLLSAFFGGGGDVLIGALAAETFAGAGRSFLAEACVPMLQDSSPADAAADS